MAGGARPTRPPPPHRDAAGSSLSAAEPHASICAKRRLRAAAGQDHGGPGELGQRWRRRALHVERARESHREPGTAGGQFQLAAGLAGGDQMLVAGCVEDCVALRTREFFGDLDSAGLHDFDRDKGDPAPCLSAEHAHQVRIAHRGERVIAHAGLRQRHVADEQVAFVDGAAVARIGRGSDGEALAKRIEQRVGHRADVAARGRVEGRAVLEVDALRASLS